MTGLNKAKSAVDLAQIQDKRAKDLFEGKAVPLKDYQQSQATLVQAQNDVRSSSDGAGGGAQPTCGFSVSPTTPSPRFRTRDCINPDTTISAPIAGHGGPAQESVLASM